MLLPNTGDILLFIIINFCSFPFFKNWVLVFALLVYVVYYYIIMCFLLNVMHLHLYVIFLIITVIFTICFV